MNVKLKFDALPDRRRNLVTEPTANVTGVPTYMKDIASLVPAAKKHWLDVPSTYYYRSPTKFTSAIAGLLLMHAISRMDFEVCELKAKSITQFLNHDYPQVIWDPISVGKMLGEVSAAAELLKSSNVAWNPERHLPFQRYRNQSGYTSYMTHSAISVMWVHAMISELAPEAAMERDDPEYKPGHGTFGAGKGSTAIYEAGYRIRDKLADLGKGDEGLKVLYRQWIMERQNLTA